MKKLLLTLGIILLYLSGTSQNTGWAMPDNYLKFTTGSTSLPPLPVPSTIYGTSIPNTPNNPWDAYDANQVAENASNMMLDLQGNIRFFIVDGFIYDGEGNLIDFLGNYGANVTGYSEIAIVPDPADCDRYYIIAHEVQNYDRYPYAFLLDMGEINIYGEGIGSCDHFGQLVPIGNSGNIALSIKGITPGWAPSYGGVKNSLGFIAVSDLRADNSYLAFITNTQGIFRYKIDATGFQYDNALIPFPNWGYNHSETRSEMELIQLSNDHYRIAVPYGPNMSQFPVSGVREVLYTAELDPNGNLLGAPKLFYAYDYNPQSVNKSARFKGLEFSEDGNRLYVTRRVESGNPQAISQFSYYDWGFPTVDLVPFPISGGFDVQYSQIELAQNDVLYFAHANGLLRMPNASSPAPNSVTSFLNFPYNSTFTPWTQKLYLLPDQIDGMDYEAYQVANQQCCINSANFEADKFVACTETWAPTTSLGTPLNPFQIGTGSDVYIKEELRIPADVNLTINNMTFHFAPGARVVIENGTAGQQGGKLTLNNTTFTADNRCGNDLWMGVEVWGNTNELQGSIYNSTQGRLILTNNSEISHAFVGALAGKRNSTITPSNNSCPGTEVVSLFSFNYNHNGGIIQGSRSKLRDNQRGVFFMPYISPNNYNNLSYFNRCDFIWDAPLYGGHSLQHQAHLYAVKGVRFVGSNFENQAQSMFPYTGLGTGIFSYKSQFYVYDYCPVLITPCTSCPNAVPSTFKHLRYGIRTINPSNPLTYSVRRSIFDDCQYGIFSMYTTNSRITENTFKIRQANYQTAGISMYRTPVYTIQENQLEGNGSPTGQLSYGIVVNNTDVANNDIYKNDFKKLHIAVQSEGVNAVEITNSNFPGATNFNMSGLNYTCNNFDSDIDLADMTIVNGRIDLFQGHAVGATSMTDATKRTARNYFSLHGEPLALEHDIKVSGSITQELHYVGLNTPNYFIDSYSQNWVLPLIGGYNGVQATATSSMCPSLLCQRDRAALAIRRTSLMENLNDLNGEIQTLSPRDEAGLTALQGKIHATEEQIDLIENQIVSLILLEEEELAIIEAGLLEIGRRDLFNELSNTIANTPDTAPVAAIEIDEFYPIVPSGGGRKVAALPAPSEKVFSVSPNPSAGNFAINFETVNDRPIDVTVTDMMGKIVFQSHRNTQKSVELDLKGLNNGVYFLLVKSEGSLLGSKKIEILK